MNLIPPSKIYNIIALFFGSLAINLNAQNQYVQDINLQLRNIFSQITYPDNDVLFLYDRSAKMSDSIFYTSQSVGKMIKEISPIKGKTRQFHSNLSGLAAGMYIVVVSTENHKVIKRLVIY